MKVKIAKGEIEFLVGKGQEFGIADNGRSIYVADHALRQIAGDNVLDTTGAARDRAESSRARAKVERERKRPRDIQQSV